MKDIKILVSEFKKVKSDEELENLLQGLLTPKEIEEFAQRIKIVRMLKSGMPQHEIAEELGVGVATVTRGSKEIKQGRFQLIK